MAHEAATACDRRAAGAPAWLAQTTTLSGAEPHRVTLIACAACGLVAIVIYRAVGSAIEVDAARLPASIVIVYRIAGDAAQLRLPSSGFARRADGLWQHSCFEAFLRAVPGASYHEFNFAPSGDWAAYRFGRPRSERSTPDMPAPRMERREFPEGYELSATLPIAAPTGAAANGGARRGHFMRPANGAGASQPKRALIVAPGTSARLSRGPKQ